MLKFQPAKVETGRRSAVIIRNVDRSGQKVVDVRLWVLSDETGELIPTRKGLRQRPEIWAQIIPRIQEACAACTNSPGKPGMGRHYAPIDDKVTDLRKEDDK